MAEAQTKCPKCGAADQYGDSCEACGATYTPADLVNALSVVSGTPPVQRESEHLFFKLGDFEAMLRLLSGARDGSAISVTLLSSDIGKLYVALAQAIDRLRG